MSQRPLLTNAARLQTSFDYWAHRIHASLGCFVLCHLAYRYGLFFFLSDKNDDGDMGFGGPQLRRREEGAGAVTTTRHHYHPGLLFALWFMPHLLLQLTGFAFPLPPARHPDGNRIWPQYRWEALAFCTRCIALACVAWRRKLHGWRLGGEEGGSCGIAPSAFCVGATMMAADWIASWYRKNVGSKGNNRTIRDLRAPGWAQYLMSSAQFHATVHCLLTSDRLSVQIAALTVVQLSAFGMTLRRKGFISQREGVALYALVLVVGMIVIFDDLGRRSLFNVALFFGNVVAVLRMYCGMNKYVMWSVIAVVLSSLLERGMLCDDEFPLSPVAMNISSWLLLAGTCYLKHS